MGVGGSKRQGGAAETLDFTIASSLELGRQVQDQILDAAKRHGFQGTAFFAIQLALEEALVNAIKHGNRLSPDKQVRVNVIVSPERIEMFIEDEGPGFDRRSVPDPTVEENLEKCSGRGILLMEAYMNVVKWDRDGRRIRLVKENEKAE